VRDINFVTMPWNNINIPSLQLGILSTLTKEAHPDLECSTSYCDLLWAEYLFRASDGKVINTDDYAMIGERSFGYGVGEWIFSSALYDVPPDPVPYVEQLKRAGVFSLKELRVVLWMYEQSRDFIGWLMRKVFCQPFKIVGLSSTFVQNVSSLALAKAIKQNHGDTVIVMGGANCAGPQGVALHRNFEFIDFVVRGEGEEVFPRLVTLLTGNGASADNLAAIPGLCWRASDGQTIANAPARARLSMRSVEPDYEDYFRLLEGLEISAYIYPQIPLESARGCWKGAKQQCAFCGVNQTAVSYRCINGSDVFRTVKHTIQKYRTLDILMVDSIMNPAHFKDLLPYLADEEWDVNIFHSVHPNLKEEHVDLLARAGVRRLQVGIESLDPQILTLMRKGVTAIENVRLLKWCQQYNIMPLWNFLYGFPGETQDCYVSILHQLPSLYHLYPPGVVGRILLVRYSPYFDHAVLGITQRSPASFYNYVYKLPKEELDDLAYIFDYPQQGITETEAKPLKEAVNEWEAAYPTASLTYRRHPKGPLHISDSRTSKSPNQHVLEDPLEVDAYLSLSSGLRLEQLTRRLRRRFPDKRLKSRDIASWCDDMCHKRFLYHSDGVYLALAIPEDCQRVRQLVPA